MPVQSQVPSRKLSGFTLIELMIVVAIVGILGTVAVSIYSSQVTKSRRTDARTALLDMAGRQEKIYSTTTAYGTTPFMLGYSSVTTATWPILVANQYYSVSVSAPDLSQGASTVPNTFIITATAVGQQAGDTQCATLSLNQLGQQTSTGTGSAALCWGTN